MGLIALRVNKKFKYIFQYALAVDLLDNSGYCSQGQQIEGKKIMNKQYRRAAIQAAALWVITLGVCAWLLS